jgi:hypothetical protein
VIEVLGQERDIEVKKEMGTLIHDLGIAQHQERIKKKKRNKR